MLSAYMARAVSAYNSRAANAKEFFQILLRSAMIVSDAGAAVKIYNAMPQRRDTDALRVARTLSRRHQLTAAIRIAQAAVDLERVHGGYTLLNALALTAAELLAALEGLEATERRRGRYVDYEEWIVRALNVVVRHCEKQSDESRFMQLLFQCRSRLVRFYHYRDDIVHILLRNTDGASLDTRLYVYAGTVVALCKQPEKWPRALQVADQLALLMPTATTTGDVSSGEAVTPVQADCVRRSVSALVLTATNDDDKERAWAILRETNTVPTSRCYSALLIAFAPTKMRHRFERASVYRQHIKVRAYEADSEDIEERMRQHDRFAAAANFVLNDMAARNVAPAPFLVTQLFSAVTLTVPSWRKSAEYTQREYQRFHSGLSLLVQTCIALGVHPTAAAIHSAVVQTCNRYGPLQALTLLDEFEALHINVLDTYHAIILAARKWYTDVNSVWFPYDERRPTLERILSKIQNASPTAATTISYRNLLRLSAQSKDDGTLTSRVFDALATALIPQTQDAHDALTSVALADADVISAFFWKHYQTPALFDQVALNTIITALAQRRSEDAFKVYEHVKSKQRDGTLTAAPSLDVFRHLMTLCQLLGRSTLLSQLRIDAERSGIDMSELTEYVEVEHDWSGRGNRRKTANHKHTHRTRDTSRTQDVTQL